MGTLADWKDIPWYRSGSFPVAVVLALMFIAMACGRLVPEDARAVAQKLIRPKKPAGRRASPRDSSGGTGRYVRGR
ncbi:hypothetical protein D6T65_02360 [Arthrobacter frigidicola]|nr:hypothetical protein D6T65_02360 [Arthrobacter frigidicola]